MRLAGRIAVRGAGLLLDWGALSFFLWLALLPLLAPVWGQCLPLMSAHLLERAAFLGSVGLAPSPSMEAFRDPGFLALCGAGSLYGFFFFNIPLAMTLAAVETCAGLFARLRARLAARAAGLAVFLGLFAPLAWAYGRSVPWFLWTMLVATLVPPLLAAVMRDLKESALAGSRWKLVLTLPCVLAIVAPLVIHPAWHILLRSKAYAGVNRLTLVRDWLLLGPDGRSLLSEWYYDHSPYAAEHSRVTVFNPLCVGHAGLDLARWERLLAAEISRPAGSEAWVERRMRFHLVQVAGREAGLDLLDHGKLDLLVLPFEAAGPLRPKEPGAVIFLTTDPAAPPLLDGAPVLRPGDWPERFPVVARGTEQVRQTPVLLRVEDLRQAGHDARQAAMFRLYRGLVFDGFFGEPRLSIPVVALAIAGACLYLFLLLAALGRVVPWIALVLALALAPSSVPACRDHLAAWRSLLLPGPPAGHPLADILALHRAAARRDPMAVDRILAAGPHADRRLAMWQAEILGLAWPDLDPARRKKAEEFLLQLAGQYDRLPINFRCKLVESLAGVPPLRGVLDLLAVDERHLYVRWYLENRGLGLKP